MLCFSDKELETNTVAKRGELTNYTDCPQKDGESYALTIHGMIHHKEAS